MEVSLFFQKFKMNTQAVLFENSKDIPEGLYIKLMDALKLDFENKSESESESESENDYESEYEDDGERYGPFFARCDGVISRGFICGLDGINQTSDGKYFCFRCINLYN